MSVDYSYDFFSAPDMEEINTPTMAKAKTAVTTEPAAPCSNHPAHVTFHPRTSSCSQPCEDWITDASYGYFTCPTLQLEAVTKDKTVARKRKQHLANPTMTTAVSKNNNSEGYSYFGI